jgi:hypothetical protein
MSDPLISRIYEVKVNGYEQSLKNLKAVTTAFQQMDATKKLTDQELKKAIEVGNAASINQLTARVKELEASLKNLDAQREKSAKEVALLAKAEKDEASAKAIITKSIIDQDKELDRQIALQEKQRQQSEKNRLANEAEAGSYKDIVNQQKQLRPFIQSTAPNSTATTPLNGQNLGINEAIAKFKELSLAEQAFRRQFQADQTLVGEYSSGIIRAFNQLGLGDVFKKQKDDINNQLKQLKSESQLLAQQLKESGDIGAAAFTKIDQQLRENITHQEALHNSLKNIDSALENTGTIGSQITRGINNGFKDLKSQVSQLALGYLGFQAVISGVQSLIHNTTELSDQTTNLEIELGKAKGGADKLVDSLRGLDTRTKLGVLEDIANIAAKAGVSEENLLGVTQALDKIKIAFGKDFGDVEQGTESLVKLVNVFEGTDQVTGENLLRVGNAVRTLANESVASVPFLNDFSKRMAGLKGISNIALPAVLGLASGFEQFGQSSEVAGTTLTKVIPKLGTDTAKYAQIASLTQQAFADLLKNNPAEALIKVSEGLIKGKAGIEEISTAFADSQLGSGRIAAVLGTIGSKADDFRKSIASAGKAYNDTANIETAFAAKNENLAATLDKLSKRFSDIAASNGFSKTLEGVGNILLFIAKTITAIPFAVIITGITALTAAWAFYKGNLIAATIAQSANNEATLLGSIRAAAMRLGLFGKAEAAAASAVAMEADAVATGEAAVATTALNTAVKFSPLGLILSIVALLVPVIAAFGKVTEDTTNKLRGQNDQLKTFARFTGEIGAQVQESVAKTRSAIEPLISIIKDEVGDLNLRKKAYEELIKIAPEFTGTLNAEYQATGKLNEIYDTYINQLAKVARAKAIQNVRQKIEDDKAVKDSEAFRAKIEADQEAAQNKLIEQQNNAKLSAATKTLGKSKDEFDADQLKATLVKPQSEKADAYKKAKIEAEKAAKEASDFNAFMKNASTEDKEALIASTATTTGAVSAGVGGTLDALQKQLKDVNDQLKALDVIKDKSADQITKIQNLRKQRAEIIKEIKELGGSSSTTTKTFTGSRLSGETKDDLKEIDAQRDRQLTSANLAFAQIQDKRKTDIDDEKIHLQRIQQINDDADRKKIEAIKGHNAAELKERESLELAIINRRIETNNKIEELNKKQFAEDSNLIKKQFEQQKSEVAFGLQAIEQDPNKSETEKATAKKSADDKIIGLTTSYYIQLDALAKKYKQSGEEIEAEKQKAITDIIKTSMGDNVAIVEARLKDIDKAYDNSVAEIKARNAKQKLAILDNDKLSNNQKKSQLSNVDNQENNEILLNSAAHAKIVLAQIKLDFQNGVATQKQLDEATTNYVNAVESYKNKTTQSSIDLFNNITTAQKGLQAGIAKLFNFDQNTEEGQAQAKLLGETIAMGFSTAQDAMSAYFDAEKQKIERSKQLVYERIDLEKQQSLAKAQSQAERDSIEKQAQVQKDKADRDAFEKNKKLQREQAKINLAMQLSNLAVVAFAPNPQNIATLGAAGAIMYGIQAALALAQYAVNIGRINSASYATGGYTGKGTHKDETGHKVAGVVHNDEWVAPKWMNEHPTYGKTIYQLEKVRKRGFATGGYTSPIGSPSLGSSLQAPVNPRSFLSTSSSSNGDIAELKQMVVAVTDSVNNVSNRVDNLKVHVVAREVEDVNVKVAKAARIGTL